MGVKVVYHSIRGILGMIIGLKLSERCFDFNAATTAVIEGYEDPFPSLKIDLGYEAYESHKSNGAVEVKIGVLSFETRLVAQAENVCGGQVVPGKPSLRVVEVLRRVYLI